VSNLSKSKEPIESDFLVDTGAIDSMVAEDLLIQAGIQEEGKAVYELANEDIVEYRYGFARVMFMGEETVT
jgi:hypothetical protein